MGRPIRGIASVAVVLCLLATGPLAAAAAAAEETAIVYAPESEAKFAQQLAGKGVDVRMMPAPETADTPYMHSKMILVDGKLAYVGSVNFSVNSTTKARELGIIFANDAVAGQIHTVFDADWAHAIAPPKERANQCGDGSAGSAARDH